MQPRILKIYETLTKGISRSLRAPFQTQNLTFYLQCYRDLSLARNCLRQLRRIFPKSALILITDGDDDCRYDQLADTNTVLLRGDRLYPIENGGKMAHRFLEIFARQPTDYLIKIDTDTKIVRKFYALPKGECLFGTLQSDDQSESVQGGIFGFSRDAALKMYHSGRLLDQRLATHYSDTWATTTFLQEEVERLQLIRFEWVISYVAKELGIPLLEYDDVRSNWQKKPRNWFGRYAAIHPAFDKPAPPPPKRSPPA